MSEKSFPNKRDCEHGQLRRQCPFCEHDEDTKEANTMLSQIRERNDNLTRALQSVLSLYPEDMENDGSGLIGFKPEVVEIIYSARKLLNNPTSAGQNT